jgi:hypothetical protein
MRICKKWIPANLDHEHHIVKKYLDGKTANFIYSVFTTELFFRSPAKATTGTYGSAKALDPIQGDISPYLFVYPTVQCAWTAPRHAYYS